LFIQSLVKVHLYTPLKVYFSQVRVLSPHSYRAYGSLSLFQMRSSIPIVLLTSILSILANPIITTYPNSLNLSASFDPIIAAYWTGLPHHRRTPFSISPDGKSAYLAYLSSNLSSVIVQQVNTTTFGAIGTPVEILGYEAAGLVAQNDGFALMITTDAEGTIDLPTDNMHVVAVARYKNGVQTWKTFLNGPGVHASEGVSLEIEGRS
jgi:hypothetical protein